MDLLVLVRLRLDRRQVGALSLVEIRDGARRIAFSCDARGKADSASADRASNQHRAPRQPFGDTPAGRWSECLVVDRTWAKTGDGIGPRWIALPFERAADPATKELLAPGRKGHRDGLGIHAGRGNGDLMATRGCLRLRDQDLARLDQLIGGRRFDVAIVEAEGEENQ